MQDNISKLYGVLKDTYDLGSEEDFRKYLSDSKKREALRKELESEYEVGDSVAFTRYLGFDKPTDVKPYTMSESELEGKPAGKAAGTSAKQAKPQARQSQPQQKPLNIPSIYDVMDEQRERTKYQPKPILEKEVVTDANGNRVRRPKLQQTFTGGRMSEMPVVRDVFGNEYDPTEPETKELVQKQTKAIPKTDEEEREQWRIEREKTETNNPSLIETVGKSIGAGFVRVGAGLVDVMQQLTSGLYVESGNGEYVRTASYEERLKDEHDPLTQASAALNDVADRMSAEAQPYGGKKGFLDLLWDGEIGKAMQKGVATAGESLPMTLSWANPYTATANAISMAGSNYRTETLENPDVPAWKRASYAIGEAAIEQAVEKYSDPFFKYVGGAKVLRRAGKAASKEIAQDVTKQATETIAKRIYRRLGGLAKDAAGEGAEEVIGNFGNDMLGQALDVLNGDKDYGFEAQWTKIKKANPEADLWDFATAKAKENVEAFIGGAMAGAYTSGTTQASIKALEYATKRAVSDAEPVEPVELEIGQSFDEGYALEGQEMNDAKNMLELQQQRIGDIADDGMMQQLREDPMAALDFIRTNPEWTNEEKQAALDYVNAKATYDGMIARVGDDIDSRIAESDMLIGERRSKTDGMIHPAVLKAENKQVYIVDGNVMMMPDGSMVDSDNSDESVIVRDAETGEISFVSPADILMVEEALDAEEERQTAQEAIRQQFAQQAADEIEGVLPFNDGDQYTVLDDEGQQHTIEVVPYPDADAAGAVPEGSVLVSVDGAYVPQVMPMEEVQRMADAYNLARLAEYEKEKEAKRAEEVALATQQTEQGGAGGEASPEQAGANEPSAATVEPMPMIGEGEDAEPDFLATTPERGHRYLFDEMGINEKAAKGIVEANIKVSQKELDNQNKELEKLDNNPGANAVKYKKTRDEIQRKADAAQQSLDYWNAVKSEQDKRDAAAQQAAFEEQTAEPLDRQAMLEEQKTLEAKIAVAKQMYGDYFDSDFTVPYDAMELVAMNMPSEKISWEGREGVRGLQQELGSNHKRSVGKGSTSGFNTYLAKKGDGISTDKAIHDIWESPMNQLPNGEKRWDTEEIRASFISMFKNAEKPSDIRDYVYNNRVRMAEEMRAAEQEAAAVAQMDEDIRQRMGMEREEYDAWIADMEARAEAQSAYENETYNETDISNDTGTEESTGEEGAGEVQGQEGIGLGTEEGNPASAGRDGEGELRRLTFSSGVDSGLLDGVTAPAGNSPKTSAGIGTEKSGNVQGNQGKTSSEEEITAQEAQVDTNPTEAQKEAGNYKKGHVKIDGYDVTIENPKGSVRSGTDASGKKWEQTMHNTYGYIRGTEGVDGDHIDVFLSDNPEEGDVYVIDQVNKDGSFDEHKVMYGFNSAEEASAAYLSNYEEGWQGLGAITGVTKEEFKKWVESSHRKTKPFADYKSVKATQGAVPKSEKKEGENAEADASGTVAGGETAIDKQAQEFLDAYKKWGEDVHNDASYKAYKDAQNSLHEQMRVMSDDELAAFNEKYGKQYGVIADEVRKEQGRRLNEARINKSFEDGLQAQGEITGTAKAPKVATDSFTAKDETRQVLNGVYHDESGYAVATDGRLLVADKSQYDEDNKRKIVASHKVGSYKKGDVIPGNYPKWRMVVDGMEGSNTASVAWDGLRNFLAGVEEQLKARWKAEKESNGTKESFASWSEPAIVAVRMPDGEICVYNYGMLRAFSDAAASMGMSEITYGAEKPLKATNDKGVVMLMPVNPTAIAEEEYGHENEGRRLYYEWGGAEKAQEKPAATSKPASDAAGTAAKPAEEAAARTSEGMAAGKPAATRTRASKVGKIDDFGEKIGGARKDVARGRIRDTKKMTVKDLTTLKKGADDILSQANIMRLYKDGQMDEQTARGFMALNNAAKVAMKHASPTGRELIMTKYRDAAVAWEEGRPIVFEVTDKDIKAYQSQFGVQVTDEKARESLDFLITDPYNMFMQTYEAIDYPAVERKLGQYVIVDYTSMKGRHWTPSRPYWVKNGLRAQRGYPFATMESAVAELKKLCPEVTEKEKKARGEKAEHGLHVTKEGYGFYIKSRNIPGNIYLSPKFWTEKEAQKYLDDNLERLKEREQRLVDALMGSNIGMAEREGVDYRNGKDVTPQDFLDEFGFRGVEFGNWVPQGERQMYLNKTYDAIKDFCAIVGISQRAFSLGGRLGLAFGARGKSRAMAHYEPGKEVINLTRMSGVGSLAHEWFHALDNYLAKQKTGNMSDMATETHDVVREELGDVFKEMFKAMRALDYDKRSRRAGEYWGRTVEEFARLFENYIYNKLAAKETTSPVLVRQDVLLDNIGEDLKNSWPYPSAEENAKMEPYFDKLFDTIQEKTDANGNVVLFQKVDGSTIAKEADAAEEALRDEVIRLMREAGIEVSTDWEEGQRVLDEVNGVARLMGGGEMSERRKEREEQNRAIDTAVSLVTGRDIKDVRRERIENEEQRRRQAKEIYDIILSGEYNDVSLQKISDYINDVTPNNPYGRRLSERLPQRVERKAVREDGLTAVDTLFSRASESSVAPNERVSASGRRAIEERKKEALEQWAKATGNWHTDLNEFTDGERLISDDTSDSDVYLSKDGQHVIKLSRGKQGKRFAPDIDNIPLFNYVFPSSAYKILGYGDFGKGFVRILEQPYVDFETSEPLTEQERVEFMDRLGFKPINKSNTAFGNGEIIVADLQKNNVVKDGDGNIHVIDADCKLHTKDVGGNYTYFPVEHDLPKGIREMRAYHGSGADFDAFDHSHMGEGEGAQAYGWGTYVTDVEGIGRTYARSMARKPIGSRPVLYKGEDYQKANQDGWSDAKKEVFNDITDQMRSHGRDSSTAIDNVRGTINLDIQFNEKGVERSNISEKKWNDAIAFLKGMTDEQFKQFVNSGEWIGLGEELRGLKYAINDNRDLGRGGILLVCEQGVDDAKQGKKLYANRKAYNEKKLEALKDFDESDFTRVAYEPTLYTVDIPEDNGSNYLDYVARMEQQANLLDAIGKGLEKLGWKRNGMTWSNETHRVGFELAPYKQGRRIYEALSKMLGGDKAASEFLHDVGIVGMKYPAEFRSGGRSDGSKNYVIFDENDAKITDKIKFFRTSNGEAYGFTLNGKIYLDPRIATSETPIHEYAHLWAQALRQANPEAWEKMKEEMRNEQQDVMDYVKRLYPEITDEDELLEEVFTHYSGKRGAERLRNDMREEMAKANSILDKARVATIFAKLRDMLSRFWNMARDLFAGKNEKLASMKGEDFADMMMNDLMSGFKPDADASGTVAGARYQFVGEQGAAEADRAEGTVTRIEGLATAKQMEADGRPALNIKMATGWERGKDGKWRYETEDDINAADKGIDAVLKEARKEVEELEKKADNLLARINRLDASIPKRITDRYSEEEKAKYTKMREERDQLIKEWSKANRAFRAQEDENRIDGIKTTLGEILGDDYELFKYYPDMKDMSVTLTERLDANGEYEDATIKLKIRNGMASTLLHEIQHAIQHQEGFAKGGNMSSVIDDMEVRQTFIEDLQRDYRYVEDKLSVVQDAKESDEAVASFAEARGMSEEDARAYLDAEEARLKLNRARYNHLFDMLNDDVTSKEKAFEYYKRIAGEVEARNVQERAYMSAEERRRSLAAETEDIQRGEQIVTYGDAGGSASIVEDEDEVARLEAEPKEVGYRNVVLNEDGTLGSPMASKLGKKGTGRKATSSFEFGKFERSDEHPELATEDGKIDLIKPDGKTVDSVDYNPYIHIRPTLVNKQFKQAWERPNLVYVRTEYPASELTSGYKAEKAKKSVGRHAWNGGELILSRWDKPIEIVPWEEVADDWVKEFAGKGIHFDIIPPKLLPILVERGMKILPPHKGMGKECNAAYEAWKNGSSAERLHRQPMFYSNAERAVEGIKQEKATPEQWLAMITKAGGLKAGEDKWMGLSEWLKGEKVKSLTKQEVLDFIRSNRVEVEDWNYAEYGEANQAKLDQYNREFNEYVNQAEEEIDGLYPADHAEWAFDRMVDDYGDDFRSAFVVQSLPNGKYELVPEMDWYDELTPVAKYFLDAENTINSTRLSYTTEGLENKREIALVVPSIESWNEGDKVHFGDAGEGRAIAWVRFGETTDADGKRVLVIDEIQSKRHQEGREKGYADKNVKARYSETLEAFQNYQKEQRRKYGENTIPAQWPKEARDEFDRLRDENNAAYDELQKHKNDVPDAPFDKNWHELAMKRMLRYAAENGYDKIAWTKGEQQAERYNIGSAVRSIDAGIDQEGNRVMLIHQNEGGTIDIAFDDEGNITSMNSVGREALGEAKNIRDVVGKEIAIEALSVQGRGTENMKTWKGDGLRIGAEGMKGFYDQILPRFMDKYGKKWGVKTGEVHFDGLNGQDGLNMWSVDVTPEMKESVMEGQPMFRDGEWQMNYDESLAASKAAGYTKRQHDAWWNRRQREKRNTAEDMAAKMHLTDRVIIVDNADELDGMGFENLTDEDRQSNGWFDPKTGKIVVILGNHASAHDVLQTMLHEGVNHYGLRELFGRNFDTFLDNVYENATPEIRAEITRLARDNGWNFRTATEEYLGKLAEDTDFENAEKSGWWQQIKRWFLDMLHKIGLPGFGRVGNATDISDNELRYILWRSYQNLVNPGRYRNLFDVAKDVVMQEKLGVGRFAKPAADAARTVAAEQAGIDLNDVEKIVAEPEADGFVGGVGIHLTMKDGNTYHLWVETDEENGDEEHLGTVEFYGNEDEDIPDEKMTKRFGKFFGEHVNTIFGTRLGELLTSKRTQRNGITLDSKDIAAYVGLQKAAEQAAGVQSSFGDEFSFEQKDEILKAYQRVKDRYDAVALINTPIGYVLINEDAKLMRNLYSLDRKPFVVIGKEMLDEAMLELTRKGHKIVISDISESGRLHRSGHKVSARDTYERLVASGSEQFTEAVQDSMRSLKNLYKAITDAEGNKKHIRDVAGYENAYLAENRMHSASQAQIAAWEHDFIHPIVKEVYDLAGDDAEAYDALTDYMMAKHGLERNRVLAERDAKAEAAAGNGDYNDLLAKFREKDYAGLTALTGEADVAAAEAAAQQMVDDYEASHYTAELWKKINAATKSSLEKLFRSGMMSKERYEKIRDMFEYYIPLQGFDETVAEDVYAYMGSDGTRLYGTPIRTAKGRKSKADDPLATIQMNGEAAIRQGNRNEMKQNFLNFVQNHPSDLVSVSDVWLRYNDVTDEWEQYFDAGLRDGDTAADVARKVEAFEQRMEQLAQSDPDHYKRGMDMKDVPFRVLTSRDMAQHQVMVRRGGKTYVLTINGNPRAAQALNGMTNPDVFTEGIFGKAMNFGQQANRLLSALYTTRNPEFVASNYVRDALYSNSMTWVKESPSYALKFHKNFGMCNPKTMGKLFVEWENGELRKAVENGSADEMQRQFYDFMMNGGETGWTSLRDIEQHKKDLEAAIRREGSTSKKAWKAIGGAFDIANRAVENSARFAAFLTSREMGRSLERSIYDAKEVSVNFNKKGSGDKFLSSQGQTRLGKLGATLGGIGRGLYVFFNAGVQGMSNIAGATKEHPYKAAGLTTALFLLGAIFPVLGEIVSGGGDDDDDYYNLPEYVRRSNIVFRFGKDKPWVKIPLPIEFRAMYGLGELACGVLRGKERYSNEELAKQFISQISQVLPLDFMEGGGGWHAFVPSVLKPGVEAYGNTSWIGLPIYRDNKFKPYEPQWTLAYDNTDKTLVAMTRWLNEATGGSDVSQGWIDWNPARIEYMLKGYLGGPFTMYDRFKKTAETAFGEREFEWRNIPVASRFLHEGDERTSARKAKSEYFDLLKEYEKTKSDYNGFKKIADSKREDAFEYAKRIDFLYNSKEYMHYQIIDNYKPLLDEYYKMEKEAEGEDKKKIQEEEDMLRRELIDVIHAVDDGKEIDTDSYIESSLERMFGSWRSDIRKKAGSIIAKRLGGTDYYGGGDATKTEYGKAYEMLRKKSDLEDDVRIQVEVRKANEGGNKNRESAIESSRTAMNNIKKYLVSGADQHQVMEDIRLLHKYALGLPEEISDDELEEIKANIKETKDEMIEEYGVE